MQTCRWLLVAVALITIVLNDSALARPAPGSSGVAVSRDVDTTSSTRGSDGSGGGTSPTAMDKAGFTLTLLNLIMTMAIAGIGWWIQYTLAEGDEKRQDSEDKRKRLKQQQHDQRQAFEKRISRRSARPLRGISRRSERNMRLLAAGRTTGAS